MIPITPPPEPENFDVDCRRPGESWLAGNRDKSPRVHPLWQRFLPDLREGFAGRCGIRAMWFPEGSVDHWQSLSSRRDLAYEWSNFRFLSLSANSAKKPAWEPFLLDPFEVQEGWFEILLPSLQMVATARVPPELGSRVEFMLEKFQLRDGEEMIRIRREWLKLFEAGELSLEGLTKVAPLLAAAVRKRNSSHLLS